MRQVSIAHGRRTDGGAEIPARSEAASTVSPVRASISISSGRNWIKGMADYPLRRFRFLGYH